MIVTKDPKSKRLTYAQCKAAYDNRVVELRESISKKNNYRLREQLDQLEHRKQVNDYFPYLYNIQFETENSEWSIMTMGEFNNNALDQLEFDLKRLEEEKLTEMEFRLSDLIKDEAAGNGMVFGEEDDDENEEESKIDISMTQKSDNPINQSFRQITNMVSELYQI